MKIRTHHTERGSLVLVVLCLLAVLGIALASYLSISNQSMKLSNRSYTIDVSRHLAEMGLEEAMRAFNNNNWATWTGGGTTSTWSVSGTTANCTINFPSTEYGGSGVTGSVKIRVDNYNAYFQSSTWNSSTGYQVNDLVGNSGAWYRAVQSNINQTTPGNLAYWVQAPIPWTWSNNITYSQYDVVNYNGTWYRCHTSCTNITPTNTLNWVSIPALALSWNSGTNYSFGSIVYDSGAWYYCIKRTGSASNATTNTSYWAPVVTSTGADAAVGASTYVVGDQFYYGDYIDRTTGWYRCIVATNPYYYASNNFSDTTKWVPSSKPFISWMYRSTAATYNFNNVVYYSGTWYRCKIASASSTPTTSSDWENVLANSGSWNWSSSASYYPGNVVYRSGSFYRCILAHSNQAPANATYWATAPLKSNAWDSNKSYSVNDTVSCNGIWYYTELSNNNKNPVSSPGYWSPSNGARASLNWNASTAYTTSSYVCYGGVWYHCILAPTSRQSPNDSTYWSAMAAPVIYAEGTATLPDGSATVKTQLRATVMTAPLFPNAIAATETLTISGAGTVDSYDSVTDPTASSTGYSAVLAATGTVSPALTVTSTTVKGYVAAPSASTTPYAPMWTYGGSATVTGSAATGVALTRVSRSPYIPQFDTQSVIQHTVIPTTLPTTLNLGTPGGVTPSVYTYSTNLSLGASNINILGPVILDIQGDLTINSTGAITIAATGSAEIHVSGRLLISGSSGIDNSATKDPKKLILICTGNTGTSQYTATPAYAFYGTIYMPNNSATNVLTVGAGQIYGALSAKNITFSGAANLHYDTSLRSATFGGVDQPCIISEWRELTDPAERAILP